MCLPFVGSDVFWQTGLAGTLPVAGCCVIATTCFYGAAREAYGAVLPAAVTAACFTLNPNVLYLASIPMTEVVFLAALSVQLLALLRYRRTQRIHLVFPAAIASVAASLTRYEGWFLIPFVSLGFFLLARKQKILIAFLFGLLASLGPMYWLVHNQWSTGDPLSFYHGPYSAKGMYERDLAAGASRYPGDHNWPLAASYYFVAGRLCTGWPLMIVGLIGSAIAFWKRQRIPVLFLLLTPCFYIWSRYGSGIPIHVPNLKPFSYYNTRYGIAFLPLCAFGAGALAASVRMEWRKLSVLLVALAVAPWVLHPSEQNWICWKESEQNSFSRRFWTDEIARFFAANYRPGDGILYAEGDVPSIFCHARLPLRETVNPGNGPLFLANAYRPDLVHTCKWAVVLDANRDLLAHTIGTTNWKQTPYRAVLEVHTKDDPVIRVYRRSW